jgi:hypothetical protein
MDMEMEQPQEKMRALNRRISLLLRIMTSASLLLMAAGMVIYMVTGTPTTVELMPVTQLIAHMLTLGPATLVTAGLLVAALMPVAILVMSLIQFIVMREAKPVIVCFALLAMLAGSYVLLLK